MADIQLPPLLRGDNAACWLEAVQLYNSKLKKGLSSKKYIHLNNTGNSEDGPREHARELMVTAKNLIKHSRRNGYSRAIDVLVQCDPTIAALVWGSVRVLLQIGEEAEQASRIAGEGILEIIRHAGRWEQVLAISGLLNSARIRKALIALYVTILDFLQSSTQWLNQGTLVRFRVSIFNSKRDKFEGKLKEMRNMSELVDKELQTQSNIIVHYIARKVKDMLTCTYNGLDSLGKITSDVDSVMKNINAILEQVEHLSDCTMQLKLDNELLALTHENTSTVNTVLSELKSLPFSITHAIINQIQGTLELPKVKQWLVLSAVEKSPPVAHADGTCSWLLQYPLFLKWSLSKEARVLWVQGHQGCGKSVMAGYLEEHLKSEGYNTFFYRFQRSASSTQSTPTSFISSLISQLLDNSREFPLDASAYQQLQTLATQSPFGPQHCAFKKLWVVAASLLKKSGSQFIFIVDAMDECNFDGPSLPRGSSFLHTLFELIQEAQGKVVIFTRPEPTFATAAQSGLVIFLDKELLLPDIMIFARKEYEQLGLPDSEMDEVLELVRCSSHGSFRWVELFLHHLGQSLHIADIRTRMRALPPSIAEFYRESLINNIQRFASDELECRKALLLAIFQAQRPLKTAEIADAFSLRPERADVIISNLCKPLASTHGGFFHLSHPSVREFFELYHETDDSSLGISFSDSHGLLAARCLSCLLKDKYADLYRIGSYLMANHGENACMDIDAQPCEDSFYDYAYKFWDYHLVRAKRPSKDLLRQANHFILSLQFAYWSERSRRDCGQLVRVTVAFGSLVPWHKGLSSEDQVLVELEKYFERPYSLLATAFNSSNMDEVLPWLARMTVGDFYFILTLLDKAALVRQQVLVGLQDLLGLRHLLTLRAKSDTAYFRLFAGKMRAGYRAYNEVVDIQREVIGEHCVQFLDTLGYKGQSEYFMADFVTAVMTWTKVSAKTLELLGPDSWLYLSAQLWYAQGMTYMGQLDLGLRIFQSIARKRRELFGPDDTFANVAQLHAGEVQLLLGRHEESIVTIEDVLVWRREVFPLSNILRLDPEITLAVAYQAAGMEQNASAIVEKIEEGAGNLCFLFERHCQIAHLKGLLMAQGGLINEAINLLQDVVVQVEEDQNNRALLWIRLDLATLLRQRNAEGDRYQASVNFDNIVKDISGDYDPGFPDEPDPPRLLAAAEKALRLVRARKHVQARKELDSEQLDWRRPSDFWLWIGGTFCKDILQIPDLALVTGLVAQPSSPNGRSVLTGSEGLY